MVVIVGGLVGVAVGVEVPKTRPITKTRFYQGDKNIFCMRKAFKYLFSHIKINLR